jgi:hypothetical protein
VNTLSVLDGCQVGDFTLDRLIATGGTSAVYAARRRIAGVEQEAAVKLLNTADSDEAQRAMHRECVALAHLDHTNIARLIDFGLAEYGGYFLAIELVDGLPVDEYCNRFGLSLRHRLQLFCAIAETVAYAHSRGVVHGDLKPANILVTADAKPKVLDFGIARVKAARAHSLKLDSQEYTYLTPTFAAPECYTGPATTASDVYSLGAVLLKLLTGCTPDILATSSRSARPKPSEIIPSPDQLSYLGLDRHQLRSALDGDLDAILCLALAPENTRYSSSLLLRDDVQRHLHSFPVQARPPSASYRLRCLLRRRRRALMLGGCIAAVIVAAIAGGVYFARAAHQERWRTVRLLDLVAHDSKAGGASWSTAESLHRWKSIKSIIEDLDYTQVHIDTAFRAVEFYCRAGDSTGNLTSPNTGNPHRARRLYRQALDILQILATRTSDQRTTIWRGSIERRFGDLAASEAAEGSALRHYKNARSMLSDALWVSTRREWILSELVKVCQQSAFVYEQSSDLQGALQQYNTAIQYASQLESLNKGAGEVALAVARESIGRLLVREKQFLRAAEETRVAVATYRRRMQNAPYDITRLLDLAMGVLALADVQRHSSPTAATNSYHESVGLLSALAQRDPEDRRYRRNLAQAYLSLSEHYLTQKDVQQAREATALALGILRPLVNSGSPVTYDVHLFAWIALTTRFSELRDAQTVFQMVHRTVFSADSPSPALFDLLARSFVAIGDLRAAILVQEHALQSLPPQSDRAEYQSLLDELRHKAKLSGADDLM